MNNKEKDAYIQRLKDFKKEVTKSKESALQFLVDLGTHTPKGNLKKAYRG